MVEIELLYLILPRLLFAHQNITKKNICVCGIVYRGTTNQTYSALQIL